MNGKQIKTVKTEVCKELNKMKFRYDWTDVSFDIEPKGLTLAGLPECLKDLNGNADSRLNEYEIVITNIRIELIKKN